MCGHRDMHQDGDAHRDAHTEACRSIEVHVRMHKLRNARMHKLRNAYTYGDAHRDT